MMFFLPYNYFIRKNYEYDHTASCILYDQPVEYKVHGHDKIVIVIKFIHKCLNVQFEIIFNFLILPVHRRFIPYCFCGCVHKPCDKKKHKLIWIDKNQLWKLVIAHP